MSDTSHRIALLLEVVDSKLRAGIKQATRVIAELETATARVSGKAAGSMEGFEGRTARALGKLKGTVAAGTQALSSLESAAATAGAKGAAAMEGLEKRTSGAFNRMLGPLADFKGQLAAVFGAAGLAKAAEAASGFERSLADVNTLLDGSGVSVSRYREQLLELSGRSSRDLLDLTKGLYDTLSSGIPAVEGAAGAFAVLEASQKAAASGGAETADVVRAVNAVLNAYKKSGLTAAQVTDKLRVTVDKGVTTMPELASSLGQIVGISSAFGVSLDEVLAVMAQLTLGGLSTSEALTSVRQIMVSLARPPKEVGERFKALGIEYGVTALKGKQLTGVLEDVIAKTQGSASEITQLFTDVDGLKGVLSLTSQGFDSLHQNLDAVKNSTGAVDRAAAKVNATFNEQWKVLKNRVTAALIQIGDRMLPALTATMNALSSALASGGLVDSLGSLAAAVARLGQFAAEHGKTILFLLSGLAAVKIGRAAMSGLDALRDKLATLGKVTSSVGATAARFGQDYGLSYGRGLSTGVKLSGAGLLKSLKEALKNPNVLAMIAAVGMELGQAFGDWLGKGLASRDSEFGDAAQEAIRKSTEAMSNASLDTALAAGFKDVEEMKAALDRLRSGAAVLLKGSPNSTKNAAGETRLGFNKEDLKDVKEAFHAAPEEAQAAAAEASARIGARIGDLENEKATLDARMEALRAEAEGARAAAEKYRQDANTTLEGFGRALAGGVNPHVKSMAAAEEELGKLEARSREVQRSLIQSREEAAGLAKNIAEGESEAAAQIGARDEDLKAKVKAAKDAERERKRQSKDAAREAERVRKEHEQAVAQALDGLARLREQAEQLGSEAGVAFLDAMLQEQERAVTSIEAAAAAQREAMQEAGATDGQVAIAEQAALKKVIDLLETQALMVQQLADKRAAAATTSLEAELKEIRAAAAERAKLLSPAARLDQEEEVSRLVQAKEKATAAEVTRIQTQAARDLEDVQAKLRDKRKAAEVAVSIQIAEGIAGLAKRFNVWGATEVPPEVEGSLRGLIGSLWDALTEGAQDAAESLGSLLLESLSYGAERLSTRLGAAVSSSLDAVFGEGTSAKVASAFEVAAQAVSDAGGWVKDKLVEGAGAVSEAMSTATRAVLGDALVDRLKGIGEAVGGQIAGMYAGFKTGLSKAGDDLLAIPGKLADVGANLGSSLTEAFTNMGESGAATFVAGLNGMVSGLNEAIVAPLKDLLGEDLGRYLGPLLELPSKLFEQFNAKFLSPALSAATAPLDRLLSAPAEVFSAFTNPDNTKEALNKRLSDVDAETRKRVEELRAKGQFSEAAKAQAEGETQKDKLRRENADAQPDKVLGRIVEQVNAVLLRVVQELPKIAVTVLNTIIASLPKVIEGLAKGIADLLKAIAPKIGPLLKTVINALIDALPVLIDALVQAIPVIIEGILQALTLLIQRLPEIVTTVIQGIVKLLPELFKVVADALPGLLIAIIDAIPVIIMAIVDALPDIISALIEGVGLIVAKLIEHLPEIIVAIVRALPQIIWALLKLIPLVVWGLAKGLGLAFAQIGLGLGRAGAKVGRALAEGGKALWSWITAAGRSFWEFVTAAGRGTKGFFAKIGGGLKSAWKATGGKIFHSGGVVRGPGNLLQAAAHAMAGAPRFADGGLVQSLQGDIRRRLNGDEVTILAKAGEGILNNRAMRSMGEAELAARNAGWTPAASGGATTVQILPDGRGVDALLRMLIGRIVIQSGNPGSDVARMLDRRAVPGARAMRGG
jgi:TP901 family phage tail tape measure protein